MKTAMQLMERGVVPTPVIRFGIRRLLRDRLREQAELCGGDHEEALAGWVRSMRESDVALVPEKANEQHYEVPAAFFEAVLGPNLKYSSAYYETGEESLAQAEEAMLALTCEHAELRDGQDVLELGCGWGSLTLWMAQRYPNSRITAVSNSAPQREFIERRAHERGLTNLRVLTRDMNAFKCADRFDRVVSVEMFEHMRNWEALMDRVAGWLRPEGKLFLHVFAHNHYAYAFEERDDSDWMSRWFFSGGMMPSVDLPDRLETSLETENRWVISGEHYARTSEHWLENLEAAKSRLWPLLNETYEGQAGIWYQRWRVFFLACAELFGFRDGKEWVVAHHLLRPRRGTEQ